MQRWTPLADQSWDSLFAPSAAQGRLYVARTLLNEIERDPEAVAAGAHDTVEVRHEDYADLVVYRTPIEAGPPPLAIYWVMRGLDSSEILNFEQ